MIDTHAHVSRSVDQLTSGSGKQVTTDQVNWGRLGGVVLAGTTLEDSKQNLEIAKLDSRYKACVGFHPEQVEKVTSGSVDQDLRNLIKENRKNIVAIGECGLDALCVDVKMQQQIFEKQIEIALDFDLPLIIHARKLNDEIIDILSKYPKHRGVFHCYTGGKKRISKIMDLGEWYFGIDGNLTYESGLVEVVKLIPQDRLLAETDCPYLTPLPYRGEKNYPQYVEFVYKKISEVSGKSFEETEKILDENAKRLFAID